MTTTLLKWIYAFTVGVVIGTIARYVRDRWWPRDV